MRTYQYDTFNRLVVVGNASTSDTLATYTYDALGRRIRKVIADLGSGLGGLTDDIPAGTTDYLYDGQQIIEDRNGSNTTVAQYVWGIYIDELIQLKDLAGSANYYLLSDLLYRATALIDAMATSSKPMTPMPMVTPLSSMPPAPAPTGGRMMLPPRTPP